jgi:hypothetical protein
MKTRWMIVLAALMLALAACSGDDAELSTGSTIITGGTNATAPSTTTTLDDFSGSPSTTLAGEVVDQFEVVTRIPNDNGEERHYVIPEGAYTDVDVENFIIELIESDPDLYGAEIFDNVDAANAFLVAPADRTDEQTSLLDRHYLATLVGRDRIEFRGPFAEFPGSAIGS